MNKQCNSHIKNVGISGEIENKGCNALMFGTGLNQSRDVLDAPRFALFPQSGQDTLSLRWLAYF